MLRSFLVLLFLWLGQHVWVSTSQAQVPGFYMKEESRKIEVPFIASNNLIVIPISINEGPPINFLLDTGVKTNIMFSKSLGEQLGMVYTRKLDLVGADGKTVLTANVSPNNHLDIGPIEGILQTMLVLDDEFYELEMVLGIPIYGVIGYEFFKYNPVKIDYDKNLLTFYRSDAMKWRPFGYRKIPLKIENSKPYILTKVKQINKEEIEAKLLIDLGANHGLLLNMETSENIALPPQFIESQLGRSLGGDLFGYVGRVRSMKIRGLAFKNVITSFPEETEFSYVIKDSGRQGAIGSELLGRTRMILDYRRDRMLIRKGSNFGSAFEYDMSGLTVKMLPTDERRYVVSSVRTESAGDHAGVQANDEIIRINKIPIDFWELADVVKLFRSEPGNEITLQLRRYNSVNSNDYEDFELTFVLERQI